MLGTGCSPIIRHMSGYSGTPLSTKLGIKEGMTVVARGAPANLKALLDPIPRDVELLSSHQFADIFILFATDSTTIKDSYEEAMADIGPTGAIWVAWPKRASGVPTDLTEDVMRALFLPTGMVDNKVCSIDETWSGLRFVVRKENRPGWPIRD